MCPGRWLGPSPQFLGGASDGMEIETAPLGMALGRATRTSPPRVWNWNGEAMSSSPWEWLWKGRRGRRHPGSGTGTGRRCPHRRGNGSGRGDGDVATPGLELERGGDVLIAVGMVLGGATGTSPPRVWNWNGEAMSSSPWEWFWEGRRGRRHPGFETGTGRRCPHRRGNGSGRGDGDVATLGLKRRGAEHRQRIAHGVSRGLKRERDPAPAGRKTRQAAMN
jgi:hypothetical protein